MKLSKTSLVLMFVCSVASPISPASAGLVELACEGTVSEQIELTRVKLIQRDALYYAEYTKGHEIPLVNLHRGPTMTVIGHASELGAYVYVVNRTARKFSYMQTKDISNYGGSFNADQYEGNCRSLKGIISDF